ncbi:hypothetical protein VpasPP24_113 [Vibrio phage Vpas_PP24]|nr:hypothetical protein VpasPP24_113 [Vibrio phage Vpas_PP24]
MPLTDQERARLSSRLVKLGDMIGDGIDTPEVRREYRVICKQLGYIEDKPRANNSDKINKAVEEALKNQVCPKCHGDLRQKRKGSYKVICIECKSPFKFTPKRRP